MHFGPKEAASIAKVLNRAGDSCRRKGSWDLIHAPVRSPNMSRPEKRSHSCYSNLQQLSITAKSGALSLLSSAEVTWSSGHIPLPSWHWSSWQLHLPVTCGTSNQLILLKVHSKKTKQQSYAKFINCSVKVDLVTSKKQNRTSENKLFWPNWVHDSMDLPMLSGSGPEGSAKTKYCIYIYIVYIYNVYIYIVYIYTYVYCVYIHIYIYIYIYVHIVYIYIV